MMLAGMRGDFAGTTALAESWADNGKTAICPAAKSASHQRA
jgi:hypothetical protein